MNAPITLAPTATLVYAILGDAGIPLPTRLVRARIAQIADRHVTAANLSAILSYSRKTWRTHRTPHFVCAALHLDGRAYRGWLALAQWSLQTRTLPDSYIHHALTRAQAAIDRRPIPPWPAQANSELALAVMVHESLQLHEQFFGRP